MSEVLDLARSFVESYLRGLHERTERNWQLLSACEEAVPEVLAAWNEPPRRFYPDADQIGAE